MISNREQAFIFQQEQPDSKPLRLGSLPKPLNILGEQQRHWDSLTPEQKEKFKANEREFKINREIK